MKKRLEKSEILKVIPQRNPNIMWETNEDGLIELTVPIKQDLYTKILKKIIRNIPEHRKIVLEDEVASDVWLACDGKNNVNAIISRIAGKFKLQHRQSVTSTTLFLQTLSKKNLIILTYSGGNKKSGKR